MDLDILETEQEDCDQIKEQDCDQIEGQDCDREQDCDGEQDCRRAGLWENKFGIGKFIPRPSTFIIHPSSSKRTTSILSNHGKSSKDTPETRPDPICHR